MAKSSYFYQEIAIDTDKYAELRIKVRDIFKESLSRYGYHRIHSLIRTAGMTVSEKVIRRIMKEEKLIVSYIKQRKYNSYKGEKIPLARDTHKSSDFIEFLKILDKKYPKGDKVRLILDNHSARPSKVIQRYLNTNSGRFEFILTPKRGSWLNLIENFFGKMAKQFLKGLKVRNKEELINRICTYITR